MRRGSILDVMRWLVLAGLLLLVLGGAGQSPVGRAAAQGGALPQFFGVVGSGDPDDLRDLGVGWQIISFDWATLMPDGPESFDPVAVDSDLLAAAQADGREIVGQIVGTPAWASDMGTHAAVPRGLDLPHDAAGNAWGGFVAELAAHFGPLGVHHWIIYDAPNVRPGEGAVRFAGDERDYARLVTVAAAAARAGDPRARFHVAAADWWVDEAAGRSPYLARLLPVLRELAGSEAPFDGVLVRVPATTAAIWDRLTETRAILEQAGYANRTIWLVAGVQADPDALLGVSEARQADFVMQAAAVARLAGAERIAIERMIDEPGSPTAWGLVAADGERRAAFGAYRRTIDLLGAAAPLARYSIAGADLLEFTAADATIFVLWMRGDASGEFLIQAPAEGEQATLIGPTAQVQTLRAGPVAWPAAYTVTTEGARRDANGFLTVAGSPRVLVLEPVDFFRVVYVTIDGAQVRLR